MNTHLIAYINWDLIVAWKVLSLSISKDKELIPFGYGSRQPIFISKAEPGNVIWVFSIPKPTAEKNITAHNYRPTLVAKLTIGSNRIKFSEVESYSNKVEIIKLMDLWCNVVISDPNKSCFFPMNDATNLFYKLKIKRKKQKQGVEVDKPILDSDEDEKDEKDVVKTKSIRMKIGKNLRFMREIVNDQENIDMIEEYAEKSKKNSVFISYSYSGNRDYALALADKLLSLGYGTWIDSLAIPKQKGVDKIPEERLFKLLNYGIWNCNLFIALISEGYLFGKQNNQSNVDLAMKNKEIDLNSWTMKEYLTAREEKKINNSLFMVQVAKQELQNHLEFDKWIKMNNDETLSEQIDKSFRSFNSIS